MANIFWGAINLLINELPSFLLIYYPFRSKLNRNAKWAIALNAGVLFTQFVVYFLIAQSHLSFSFLQINKLVLLIPCSVIALVVIDDNKFKILYFISIMLTYLAAAVKTGNCLAYYLFTQPSYFQLDAVNFAVTVITLPFMLYFTKRILIRTNNALGETNADIWKTIWIIPVLFCFLNLAANYHLNPYVLIEPEFLVINFVTVAGMLISSTVLLKTMQLSANYAMLKENARMTEQQLTLQGNQYEKLTDNIAKSRAERHDMRHQLAALKGYLHKGDAAGAERYCDELNKSIPIDYDRVLCQNFAVNSLALHYLAIAENEDISVTLKLDISEKSGKISDKDLCIVIGNFFENAIEACRRMENHNRFIKLKAGTRNNYLIIVMDNSFDGSYKQEVGTFFSQKHEGAGIGLSSVKSVAEKYGGSVDFQAKDAVFFSLAMARIDGAPN